MPNDPVSIVCHCLRLGNSLSFLFNALRLRQLELDPEAKPPNIGACKKRVIHFLMALKSELGWVDEDLFQVTDVYKLDTTGTVKVMDCVLRLLGELENRGLLMEEQPQESEDHMMALDNRGKVVKEILDTERTYVASLEIMQDYKRIVSESGIISHDQIFEIFINLDTLVDFQRRFLIGIEAHASQPADHQRLGHLFTSMESAFDVYEPYCQKFSQANNLVEELKSKLEACSDVLPPSELHAQLIKPVQRVCKYPLLLLQLIKVTEPSAPHFDELKKGWEASKRVADRVNEALRRSENEQAVFELGRRVEDWKSHDINGFGALLLEDTFFVLKSESEREYHVYLFEKIILCCKEMGAPSKKNSKSNSMISTKRQSTKKKPDLQLKGRIFINNVLDTQAIQRNGGYLLQVTWRGPGGTEAFSIKTRTEDTLKLWLKTVNKAVEDANAARPRQRLSNRHTSPQSQFPSTPMSELGTPLLQSRPGSMPYGASNVFEEEHGDYVDGLESRRGPHGTQSMPPGVRDPRNSASAQSARPRAQTQDSSSAVINQWRSQTPGSTSNAGTVPNLPRGASISSNASDASSVADSLRSSASSRGLRSKPSHDWGHTGPRSYDEEYSQAQAQGPSRIIARNGSLASLPAATNAYQQPMPPLRNRSASSPHVYQMPMSRSGSQQDHQYSQPVPNVPPLNLLTKGKGNMSSATLHSTASASTNDDARRFSQSSMESHRSSGDSTQSQAYTNITSPSSAGMSSSSLPFMSHRMYSGDACAVRIKVRFGKDAYVIAALSSIGYHELVEKVVKKIRLCGDQLAHIDDSAVKLRYEDEEGDKILISSDEDITLAFEGARFNPSNGGPQLTIYVD